MRGLLIAAQQVCYRKLSMRSPVFEKNSRVLKVWFGTCAGMCALTTVAGGVTRLTESGLSMTDWKFLGDVFLPVNEEQWTAKFERYKQFPEWTRLNNERGMKLNEFKFI